MIIRIVLITLVFMLFLWFFKQRASTRNQAWGKLGALGLFILAVLAILFPDATNTIAHEVGVGRGADLLIYCLTIVFIASLLLQYLRRQEDQHRVVKLARKLAIMEANQIYAKRISRSITSNSVAPKDGA